MRYILILLICFFSFTTSAQNAQDIIDVLKKQLNENPDDKKRATIYSDIAWYYANISVDSSTYYCQKAILESKKISDSTVISQIFSDAGAVYFRKDDFKTAKKYYLKSYAIRKAQKDYNGLNKININLAAIYMNTNQYNAAMKTFFESLKYCENNNDEQKANVVKSNIGDLFHRMKNYPKAIKYLNESIQYNEKNKNYDRLCESYLNLGNVYKSNKDYDNADRIYQKSIKNCKLVDNKKAISIIKQSLSVIKLSQDSVLVSKKLLAESEKLKNEVGSNIDKANLKITVIRELIKSNEYKKALILLQEIKPIFEKNEEINDIRFVYKFLIPVFANLNQPDSVTFYSDKYTKLLEKEMQVVISKQTKELETKYQTAKKEKLIIQQEAEAKQKNTYLVGLSFLAVFVSLIGFLIYRQQKLKNTQQEQEFKLKSAISHIETQNKLQEQRLSISRDLHDNIGSQLTFIISSVDNVKYGFDIQNEKLDAKLTNISSFAKDTIVELRDTIWAMNSNEISYQDLEIRINNFIEKAKEVKDNISFSFAIDDSLKTQKLTSVQGMNVYRTIQEAINNSLKYAQPEIISVNIKKQDNYSKITITDNGKGFDMQNIEKGNGLNNMQKRIEEIGGKFQLSSSSDGTKIEILI